MHSFFLYAIFLLTSSAPLVSGQTPTCSPNRGGMCGIRTSNNRPCCYPWTCDSKTYQCLRRVGDTCIENEDCATPNKCINGKCKNPNGNGASTDCGMTQGTPEGPCIGPNSPTPSGIVCCPSGYRCGVNGNPVILGKCKAMRGRSCTENSNCANYPANDVCFNGICTAPFMVFLNRPCCSGNVCSSSTICNTSNSARRFDQEVSYESKNYKPDTNGQ